MVRLGTKFGKWYMWFWVYSNTKCKNYEVMKDCTQVSESCRDQATYGIVGFPAMGP